MVGLFVAHGGAGIRAEVTGTSPSGVMRVKVMKDAPGKFSPAGALVPAIAAKAGWSHILQ